MQSYLLSRLVLALPTLLGITILVFLAMRVLPGDPVSALQGEGAIQVMSEEDIQAARHSLGLDRPLHEQYLAWMNDIVHLEFGHSFWRNEPIGGIIARRGPITAEIALLAMAISWLVGLPVGIVSAVWRNKWPDTVARLFVILFVAVPSFWIALLILLVLILGFTYRPPISIIYLWDDPWGNLQICLGPAFVLGVTVAALTARMTRSATLEVLQEDYVRTARAKGLKESILVWRHVLRNSLLPVVTVSGVALGGLLGGSVAVERAFLVPGLGTALVSAVGERDWMMIQNLVLLYGVVFALVNLLIDLTYGWLDPRIRYEG